ncbi:pentapeptide repeat-containing protein [bacterium]|nr:pentapeptide repeat-containing protein [bacterium]
MIIWHIVNMNSLLRTSIWLTGCFFWMLCALHPVSAVYAQSPSGATQTATQAVMATPSPQPTVTPTPIETALPMPTITPTPTATVTEFSTSHLNDDDIEMRVAKIIKDVTELSNEQALQMRQWEKLNRQSDWNFWLSVIGGGLAFLALFFTGWRTVSFYNQTREQMLASYRERLFKNDPGEVIAAAMSLSKYPTEAIWLVMRFAQQYKDDLDLIKDNLYATPPNQIRQAIQDALGNMSERYSWAWRKYKSIQQFFGDVLTSTKLSSWERAVVFIYLILFGFFITYFTFNLYIYFGIALIFLPFFIGVLKYKWVPWRVRGARLDGKTLSIEIGPVRLPHAYLVKAKLFQVGLAGADLTEANLQDAYLIEANLQGADLYKANLQGADLQGAKLQGADLYKANLQGAYLQQANLQGADLTEANLQGAQLRWANLQGADLTEANLQGAELYSSNLDDALLNETKMQDANLIGSSLRRSTLRHIDFENMDLTGVNFLEASLTDVCFVNSDLCGSYFKCAKLNAVFFDGANLKKSTFDQCKIDVLYLSYINECGAYIDENQLKLVKKFNLSHTDAPWLQSNWRSWTEYLFHENEETDESKAKREQEIKEVGDYIAHIRETEGDQIVKPLNDDE